MNLPIFKRHPLFLVFAGALLVRAVYLLFVPQPPVQFDARRYAGAALALPLVMGDPTLLSDTVAQNEIDFAKLYFDKVKDEHVIWLDSHPPTFAGAVEDVFFAGPVYPTFVGIILNFVPRFDFWVIRFLQAIIDSVTAVMLWLLVRQLVSGYAAWWVAGAYSVYGPSIYKTGEIVTETVSIAMTVAAALLLVRASGPPFRWRAMVGAGLLCGLLVLTRAAAMGLVVPLAITWGWANRARFKVVIWGWLLFGSVMAMALIPWGILVHERYGSFGLRDPEYAGGNFRSSNILHSEGYDLDRAPADFWTYPVWNEIRQEPGSYAVLYLRKLYRLWSRPYDDFRRGFPFGASGTLWLHRVIVILALFGVFAWAKRAGPVAFIPLGVIAYVSALHMAFHVVARYNMPAMPFLMGAAAAGVEWLVGGGRVNSQGERRRWISAPQAGGMTPLRLLRHETAGRFLLIASGLLGMLALVRWLRPPLWLMFDSLFDWKSATWAFWIAGVVAIVAGVVFLVRHASRERRIWVGTGVSVVLVALFLTQAVPREGHADWSVVIDEPNAEVRRVTRVPEGLTRDSVYTAFLSLDLIAEEERDCLVTISTDGIARSKPVDSLVSDLYFYRKFAYRAFLRLYGHRTCDVRQWVVWEIPREAIDSMMADHRLEIVVKAEPLGDQPGGLIVHGDLPVADYRNWNGPTFATHSIERYYEGGDPRIWGPEALDFEAAECEYVHDGRVDADDLSDEWGRQIGQYRLFVTVITTKRRYVTF